ncbi:type I restriction endonuclease subunit R [Janibacter massiliensis]|uniref:type I restriction endonuclease subunit R n=1 Tax=Janibacter massiliensis TaxID=2058291 RepID=UPI000D0F064B|nr:DEAD/DEAH box helicase family protein [Janibacter massiliensis]
MAVTHEVTFEANIESHLTTHGWSSVAPVGYDRKRGIFPNEVIAFVQASQPKAWNQLKARHGSEGVAVDKFLAVVVKELDRRGVLDVLRNGVKDSGVRVALCYFKPASGLNEDLRVKYEANGLAVVRQLHHSETRPQDSLDLTLVVNGVPVATAELKNPLSGQGIEQAMDQYRADRNPADLIFRARTLVHFAVDPHQVAMTTRLAGDDTRFLPFNQGTAGPGNPGAAGNPPATSGYQTAYLWEQVWQRDAWLDLLGSFIHVSDGKVLFPRFHQWHAVRSLLAATRRDGAGVDRLVQHSAGSGKSNTIAWAAHALSRLHGTDDRPIFDKVVVITDRTVLDRQLQDTVAGLEHTPGTILRVDKNSAQLKEALEGNAARVIIATLQKFPVVIELARKAAAEGGSSEVAGRRFAVIVDEAHSSTGGDAVKQLKRVLTGTAATDEDALEDAEAAQAQAEEAEEAHDLVIASAQARGKQKNLSFFAFTATPKPKTLELFGQRDAQGDLRPFHTYSMRQAIDEGFIHDVLASYTTYGVYYRLANSDPASPAADIEVDKGKGRAALARFASLHPHEMEAKAEVIVEHFRQKAMGKINGQAKAMVVTRSRLHAVRTHEAIQRYITRMGYDHGPQPLQALIAFSGSIAEDDAPDVVLTEASINGFPESQLPKRFKEPDARFLVVAEKYQTGFDEPLLHTMYVDKKLAGVKAVQTLSRLNRTAPGKADTFVLDFANTAEEIREAFSDFYEQSVAAPTDPNMLYTLQHDLESAGVLSTAEMDAAVELLLSGGDGDQPGIYANVDPAAGRWIGLDDETAEEFRGRLDQFVRAYGFLAQVVPWTDPSLERLYLYGRLLLALLPSRESDPMPQLSSSVQLTHLRLAVTHEGRVELEVTDEPGVALPGEGKGRQAEPEKDKLSALIEAMNEKFGADLGNADKIWVEQQTAVVLDDDHLRDVARNNDRSAYELVLERQLAELLLDRHSDNTALLDMFFEKPGFKQLVVGYLADQTYTEFRRAAV